MRRILFSIVLLALALPSVGCCYRSPGCDPCRGVAYGGGLEPCPTICDCLHETLFGWTRCFTCGYGSCGSYCGTSCDPGCCAPAPVGPGCCAPGMPGPVPVMPSAPTSVITPSSQSYSAPLSVPAVPSPIPSNDVTYQLPPHVQSGVTIASPPARDSKVYEQAAVSPWINAK